jgi:hypothetical protein
MRYLADQTTLRFCPGVPASSGRDARASVFSPLEKEECRLVVTGAVSSPTSLAAPPTESRFA